MLVLSAERDPEHGARLPVVPYAVDNAEPLALDDVDALFAVLMLAGVRAGRDIGDCHLAAPGTKTVLRSGHEGDAKVLGRLDPLQLFFVDHGPGVLLFLLGVVPELEPLLVKIAFRCHVRTLSRLLYGARILDSGRKECQVSLTA